MGQEDSTLVLSVPEIHLAHTLRAWENFEDTYEGKSVIDPIYLCESNKPYDPEAADGVSGIDPNLVSGLPVRMGTRTAIWFPLFVTAPPFGRGHPYIWVVEWRMRNCFDHRNTAKARMPFHMPKQSPGVPTTVPPNPGARVIIPAVYDTQIYVQTEPALMADRTYVHLRQIYIQANTTALLQPYMPNGERGVVQQGIYQSNPVPGYNGRPGFMLYETQSIGDELLISIWRDPDLGATWEFAGLDRTISKVLGKGSGAQIPDLGVYVMYGVTP